MQFINSLSMYLLRVSLFACKARNEDCYCTGPLWVPWFSVSGVRGLTAAQPCLLNALPGIEPGPGGWRSRLYPLSSTGPPACKARTVPSEHSGRIARNKNNSTARECILTAPKTPAMHGNSHRKCMTVTMCREWKQ